MMRTVVVVVVVIFAKQTLPVVHLSRNLEFHHPLVIEYELNEPIHKWSMNQSMKHQIDQEDSNSKKKKKENKQINN
jgi:hypothetical protein